MERTREQHAAILAAIATRRPEPARSWATVHVAGVADWLRGPLGRSAEPDRWKAPDQGRA